MSKYLAIWVVLLMACGGETTETTDDAGEADVGEATETVTEYFNEEAQLTSKPETTNGMVAYYPAPIYHAFAVGFEAPNPPYQIKSFGLMGLNYDLSDDDDPNSSGTAFSIRGEVYRCSAAVPVELVAWVEEDDSRDPAVYTVMDQDNVPQLPALASGMTTGLGPDDTGDESLMTVEFDNPIRVNTAGTLYVAVRIPPQPAHDPDAFNYAPCIKSVNYDGAETTWFHRSTESSIPGWEVLDGSRVEFEVTLGVHVDGA